MGNERVKSKLMYHSRKCTCCVCGSIRGEHKGINSYRYKRREERICECGCGTTFMCKYDSKKRFVIGHNMKQSTLIQAPTHSIESRTDSDTLSGGAATERLP
jgi:hypothetical protein